MYRVFVEPSGLTDIARHYRYLSEHRRTAHYADLWFDGIDTAILELREFPLGFALAPENSRFMEEIRHRVVGSYRVIFTVEDDRVHVLHVRHVRQKGLAADEDRR